MDSLIQRVAKRAAVVVSAYRPGKPDGNYDFELPTYAIASLIFTGVLFIIGMSIISYTYNSVVATLAMVESPAVAVFEAIPSDDTEESIDKKSPEAELIVVRQVPVTSSLRATINHLRQYGGYASRFRGVSLRIVYTILVTRLIFFLNGFLPMWVAVTASVTLLARLDLSWTHIVITKPSPKYWFRRLASFDSWKKIALPAALVALIHHTVIDLNMKLVCRLGLHKLQHAQYLSGLTNEERNSVLLKIFLVVVINVICGLVIILPLNVALRRVQASLLPEDQETIVPFDRTCGGKMSGGMICMVGLFNAWRSFDWNSRIRLIKIYVKVAAIQFAFAMLFGIAILAELRLFLGNDFGKIMDVFSRGEAKILDAVDF